MKRATAGRITFYDFRNTLGVEFVHGQQVRHDFSRHTHRMLCIGVVEYGARILLCRGERYEIGPGQVFIIPPEEAHACGWTGEPYSYRLLQVSTEVLQMILPKGPGDSYNFKTLVIKDNKRFAELLNLYAVLMGDESSFFKQSVLVTVVGDIVECYAAVDKALPVVHKQYENIQHVRNFIENHYEENISLADIAKKAYLSPYYLIRVFSQLAGIPPHVYQQQVRIRHAKEMLIQGVPIVEVAMKTGFTDQSHFSNTFKMMVGITPGEYVKSVLSQ